MCVAVAPTASIESDWTLARDGRVRRSADRPRRWKETLSRPTWLTRCSARPVRASRSGSITWSVSGSGDLARTSPVWVISGKRYSIGRGSRLRPSGRDLSRASRWFPHRRDSDEDGLHRRGQRRHQGRIGAAFSRAHDLGLEILGYPMGPCRTARVSGRQTESDRGRAPRLPRVRAVSR